MMICDDGAGYLKQKGVMGRPKRILDIPDG